MATKSNAAGGRGAPPTHRASCFGVGARACKAEGARDGAPSSKIGWKAETHPHAKNITNQSDKGKHYLHRACYCCKCGKFVYPHFARATDVKIAEAQDTVFAVPCEERVNWLDPNIKDRFNNGKPWAVGKSATGNVFFQGGTLPDIDRALEITLDFF